jgi:hypothetical protein
MELGLDLLVVSFLLLIVGSVRNFWVARRVLPDVRRAAHRVITMDALVRVVKIHVGRQVTKVACITHTFEFCVFTMVPLLWSLQYDFPAWYYACYIALIALHLLMYRFTWRHFTIVRMAKESLTDEERVMLYGMK